MIILSSTHEKWKNTGNGSNITWQPLGPLLKVKLLVGPTCKIPRSTQRSCPGIRRSPEMCHDKAPVTSFYSTFYIARSNLSILPELQNTQHIGPTPNVPGWVAHGDASELSSATSTKAKKGFTWGTLGCPPSQQDYNSTYGWNNTSYSFIRSFIYRDYFTPFVTIGSRPSLPFAPPGHYYLLKLPDAELKQYNLLGTRIPRWNCLLN